MEAIYHPSNVTPAFQLDWGLTGRLQSLIRSSVPKAFQRNGCKIDQSPEDIALGFLNSGAIALGRKPQFTFGYYAGTTGEYDLGAV